jgi:trehalose synthase-fused probable maltokinase
VRPEELADRLVEQRWFGSKGRELTGVEILDQPTLDAGSPPLSVALLAVHFAAGADEIYQLPLVTGEDGEDRDLLADREASNRLLRLLEGGGEAASGRGVVDFAWGEGKAPVPAGAQGRPIAAEQSNSSVVYGENAILKIYRRLEPGTNPELEMLRFLDARGFRQIPALLGWLGYRGPDLEATLGLVQEFVADGRDGWEWALDRLGDDAASLLGPLRDLGRVVGAMHTALAGDPDDPAFAPEERDAESAAALVAALDEQIDHLFLALPDDPRLAPIAGRQEELRDQLRAFAASGGGMAIRVHGDLHLGQTLIVDRGWTILDFEGEPARTLAERKAKHSPLRDVAGLLRSIAYAPLAARLQRDAAPPADWEERARVEVLDGYLESVAPSLLPPTRHEVDQLLAIYELEKAVYELNYELNHRPDWVEIPVAGITRLLEVTAA